MAERQIEYNGGLTREQFLFYEIRIVARLLEQGLGREEICKKVLDENLFQFPTEREIKSTVRACFKRIDALDSADLVLNLAECSSDVGKQINLYAMMKYNRIVWDFMTSVIGEKYRVQDFNYSKRDTNVFFIQLQEQNDRVADWSDLTIKKIKTVLNRSLVECEYLDSVKSQTLNPVSIVPELEEAIIDAKDFAALPAFNCFR